MLRSTVEGCVCSRRQPARGLSAGKPAPGTTASPPLPLARPRPSARELGSSSYGPRRSGRRETAAAAAAATSRPNPLPVPRWPGAASLCVPLTCQSTSRLEPAGAEPGSPAALPRSGPGVRVSGSQSVFPPRREIGVSREKRGYRCPTSIGAGPWISEMWTAFGQIVCFSESSRLLLWSHWRQLCLSQNDH
nr:calcium-binding protein 1-like [Microcebus murinus]